MSRAGTLLERCRAFNIANKWAVPERSVCSIVTKKHKRFAARVAPVRVVSDKPSAFKRISSRVRKFFSAVGGA